jgi:4-amino-4-deoxy-L-arabinose transferase and related glycosyltransferases of PMT family
VTPPSTASTTRLPRAGFWLLVTLMAAAYIGAAAFHVAFGALNVDEGFYAAATRSVWQGEMPYRDFGFTQPPLVAYANAPLLGTFGFGLFQQRIANGLWAALALLVAAWLVQRRTGAASAVLLIALFALAPPWMYFVHLGKTYGLTSFLAMLATAVFLAAPAGWKRSVALSFLAVLGLACRLPAAPFFGLLWLAALFEGDRPLLHRLGVALAALLASAAVLLLPFYLAAPEQLVFWTVDFHRISVPRKDWRLTWNIILSLAPALWILALAAIAFSVSRRLPWRREHAVLVAALITLAFNLLPHGAYEEYGVPFLPPLATAALLLLVPVVSGMSRRTSVFLSCALLTLPFALTPAVNWRDLAPPQRRAPSLWLPPNVPVYRYNLPAQIAAARDTVQRLVPAEQPLVGPAILLAIEAGRPIPPRFRMGAFSMTFDYPAERAHALHLATGDDFERFLRDIDVPILAFHTNPNFNYLWSVPSFDPPPPDRLREFERLFNRYFVPIYGDDDFLIAARPHVLPVAPP